MAPDDQEGGSKENDGNDDDEDDDDSRWKQTHSGNAQALTLDSSPVHGSNNEDPFTANLMSFYPGGSEYQPVLLNRAALLALETHDIIVCRWPKPLRYQFFKNIMPEMFLSHTVLTVIRCSILMITYFRYCKKATALSVVHLQQILETTH
ncbi:intraflagellar transport protein 122 homolog [Macrobrachium nipponense]|uniref:intraflagellar transport protein 122 homolog n=1 Tax=Macrobrachium nipponense TaxID=159736 RepID=UPI0030C7F20C